MQCNIYIYKWIILKLYHWNSIPVKCSDIINRSEVQAFYHIGIQYHKMTIGTQYRKTTMLLPGGRLASPLSPSSPKRDDMGKAG